jgi:undecaprenyl diphosphate synthase
MQSTLKSRAKATRPHVAIIMDGNGRWATRQGLPREAGHRAGVEAVRRIVEAAPEHGIGTLTLYAFSADNWRRPRPEVAALFSLLRQYLHNETARLTESGVRLAAIGRRDRLPKGLAAAIARAEAETTGGDALSLRIALDYSSRDAILAAAARMARCGATTREEFARLLGGASPSPDVDLLIRTSGEQRLSDFLLWECAYAELYFADCLWPDFGPRDLAAALSALQHRQRRFGGLSPVAAA